jgi:hypothetical protein
MGELFVGVEHRRLELLLRAHDVVRHVVAIRPRDRRPDGTDTVAGVKLKLSITTW